MEKLDSKRIGIFLLFAFGISWTMALIVFLTGGLVDSPQLVPGTPITLAFVLVSVGFMWSPALAHILTRVVTREGWRKSYIRPNFRRGWLYWLAAWILPAVLTILGAALFFIIFPNFYDPSMSALSDSIPGTAGDVISPWLIVLASTVQAVLIAPLVNGLFTFGEEFGWRAYLQPRLMPLGGRKAMLLMGLIWGVWHWPIIFMGHSYGLAYQGYPWLGFLVTIWIMFCLGTFLGWVTLKGGSVWPAVIGHGAINGIASIGILFAKNQPNPLLGPFPTGIIASIPWALMVLILFLLPGALKEPENAPGADTQLVEVETTSQD